MGVNLKKIQHILLFVVIIPLISIFFSYIFHFLLQNPPFWLDTVTPLFAYGILFKLFDNYFWKWKFLSILDVVDVPNLNGRWEGNLISSYFNTKTKSVIEVEQTFSSIKVTAYYEKSQSESVCACFSEINGNKYLLYYYENEPNILKDGSMQAHKGTAQLKFIPDKQLLKGSYYNNIGNRGDVELQYKGAALYNRFKI